MADTVPESLSNQGHSYDVEHKCYEARLFCESLLKGNHSIIGLTYQSITTISRFAPS